MLTEKNIRNIFIYAAPLFAGYGLTILTLPILTRLLTPHEFGIVALAWAFPTLAVSIFTCGLSSAVQRYYFEYRTDEQKINALIFSAQLFLYGALFVSATGVFFLKEHLSRLTMLSSEYGTAVFVAFLATYLGQIVNFYLILYQNMEKATIYSSLTIIQALLSNLIGLLLVWRYNLSYMGLLYSVLLGNLIVCAYLVIAFNKGRNVVFSGSVLIENIKYGLQIMPKSLTSFINKFFDKYLLNNMLSLSAVGVYNIGQTVGNSMFFLMGTVWSSLQPHCYKEVFDKGDDASVSTGRLFTLFCYIALFPLLLMILFAEEIVFIIAPPSYHEAVDIIIIITGGIATQVFGMFVGVQYAYSKKAYWIFPITVLGTLANVLANILLIPRFGLIGGGLSTAIMYCITNGAFVIVGQKLYRINYEWSKLVQLFTIILTSIVAVLLLRSMEANNIAVYGAKLTLIAAFIFAGVKINIITRHSFERVFSSLLDNQRK